MTLPYRKRACVILLDDKDRVLLMKHGRYTEKLWQFPGGGIDAGESVENAAKREIKEEFGVDITVIDYYEVKGKYDWDSYTREHVKKVSGNAWQGQEEHVVIARMQPGKLIIEEGLCGHWWVPYEEVLTYLRFPGQKKFYSGAFKAFAKHVKKHDRMPYINVHKE